MRRSELHFGLYELKSNDEHSLLNGRYDTFLCHQHLRGNVFQELDAIDAFFQAFNKGYIFYLIMLDGDLER